MSVSHLSPDFGVTARRVAWIAGQLDDVMPDWQEHIDPSLFEHGEIETSPLGQARASLPTSDPRWSLLAEMC